MIRTANLGDLPVIVRLKQRMIEEAGLALLFAEDVPQQAPARYTALYANRTAQHFVVEQDDRIVACADAYLKAPSARLRLHRRRRY